MKLTGVIPYQINEIREKLLHHHLRCTWKKKYLKFYQLLRRYKKNLDCLDHQGTLL